MTWHYNDIAGYFGITSPVPTLPCFTATHYFIAKTTHLKVSYIAIPSHARPHRVGHKSLMAVVCPSVCPVPDPKSRMEGHSKLKIGSKEAPETGDPWPYLEFARPKVKVSRPLYAVTENQPYLPKRETDELWYRGEVRWHASPTCAVKGQRSR